MGSVREKCRRLVLAAGLCFAGSTARAAEIADADLFVRDGWLHLALRAHGLLDDRTRSTIDSGLPGSCVYHLTIEDRAGRTRAERLLEFALRFDVWEEFYELRTPWGVQTFTSLSEADAAWANLTHVRLQPWENGDEIRVRIRVSVQPVSAHERARVAEYVSRSGAHDREEFSVDVGALVRRLFSSREDDDPGTSFVSPFVIPSIREEDR